MRIVSPTSLCFRSVLHGLRLLEVAIKIPHRSLSCGSPLRKRETAAEGSTAPIGQPASVWLRGYLETMPVYPTASSRSALSAPLSYTHTFNITAYNFF